MPTFRFHVCDGEGFCEDPEGVELADANAAREQAVRIARDLMADEIREGRLNLASFIEVEDAKGRHLFTLTFDDVLEIRPSTERTRPPREPGDS